MRPTFCYKLFMLVRFFRGWRLNLAHVICYGLSNDIGLILILERNKSWLWERLNCAGSPAHILLPCSWLRPLMLSQRFFVVVRIVFCAFLTRVHQPTLVHSNFQLFYKNGGNRCIDFHKMFVHFWGLPWFYLPVLSSLYSSFGNLMSCIWMTSCQI